jgi:Amt family ammonium transporter
VNYSFFGIISNLQPAKSQLLNQIMKRYFPFLLIVGILILTFIFPSVDFHNVATNPKFDTGDIAWMLMSTALVLIMTPGLAFFYGGMVSKKNVLSTMLQSFVCMGLITIIWVVFGFSMAFGEDVGGYGFIGNPASFFMMQNTLGVAWGTIPVILFAMFQLKFPYFLFYTLHGLPWQACFR